VQWYQKELDFNIEPETQANGLGRASSFSEIDKLNDEFECKVRVDERDLEEKEVEDKLNLSWARSDRKIRVSSWTHGENKHEKHNPQNSPETVLP